MRGRWWRDAGGTGWWSRRPNAGRSTRTTSASSSGVIPACWSAFLRFVVRHFVAPFTALIANPCVQGFSQCRRRSCPEDVQSCPRTSLRRPEMRLCRPGLICAWCSLMSAHRSTIRQRRFSRAAASGVEAGGGDDRLRGRPSFCIYRSRPCTTCLSGRSRSVAWGGRGGSCRPRIEELLARLIGSRVSRRCP